MSDQNKRNVLYFESPSMRGLYDCMENWQRVNHARFLSACVHQDAGKFCCIALTNPMEVVITGRDGRYAAHVNRTGSLNVDEYHD